MIDLKETTVNSVEWGFQSFGEDLDALPEEAFDRHFGGKARTVADFVHEVILVNNRERMIITGQKPFDFPSGWVTAPEDQRTKATVCAAFRKSAGEFLAAVKSMSHDELVGEVATGRGPSTRLGCCRFVAWHAGYHGGQLNYVQTLLGDDQWHWS